MLSIAICTYNRAEQLRYLLENLVRVLPALDAPYELLLIDNNSNDSTAEVVKAFLDRLPMRYIFEPEQGLSNARNRALLEFTGDALWFLDDDISIELGAISCYLNALASQPQVDFFGGPIEVDWCGNKPLWLNRKDLVLLDGFTGNYNLGDADCAYAPDVLGPYGANFIVRRRLVEKLGKFNPRLGVRGAELGRGEETEYFARAFRAGANGHYLADARVSHRFQIERLNTPHLYRYGVQKGREQVALNKGDSDSWLMNAVDQALRGCWQLLTGNRANYYQCIINMGIARGRFLATQSTLKARV